MKQPRCLVCEEWIDFFQDGDPDLPIEAVCAQIPGNVGSKVYDMVGGEHLSAYVCDECLRVKIRNGFIDRVQVAQIKEVRIRHMYTVPGD